jgi:dTDP-glucose 4,6-dehydratase
MLGRSSPIPWVELIRILVTGGLGFIGSNFIRHLLSSAADVGLVNVDDMSYGSNPANLSGLSLKENYRFVKGNIANEALAGRLVSKSDIILNFAAETHVDRSIALGRPFVESNVFGVYALLEALRQNKRPIKFIQIGTDEEYGETPEGSFTEESLLRPSSPYAATKASASMLVSAYVRTYGLDALLVRCTNNFGPYQFPEKLIPKTIVRATKNLSIPIYGSGRQVRDWIFVADYCEALLAVMRSGRTGETYNVSAGNEIDNLSLVKRILHIMQKPASLIEHVEDRPGHDFRYSLDSSKIRKDLGWKPTHSFDGALVQTVKWYAENMSWWQPIASEQVLSSRPWKRKW